MDESAQIVFFCWGKRDININGDEHERCCPKECRVQQWCNSIRGHCLDIPGSGVALVDCNYRLSWYKVWIEPKVEFDL